jgi:hypothetical protein
VPQDESHVSVGGLLALGYGSLQRLRKEARSENCMEDKLTEIGSKWPKEQKRWSEVRESNYVGWGDRGRQINKEGGSWMT